MALLLNRRPPSRLPITFVDRIAAAWLDAEEFCDRRAEFCMTDDDEVTYWRGCADRCESQAGLVIAMV